jgi:predicted DNA-binding protein YlxM (UPF0122 family)
LYFKDNITLKEERDTTLIKFLEIKRNRRLPMLETPENIRSLQRKLYRKAKQKREYRFYALYDKVYRVDILHHAYQLVKSKRGTSGMDGVSYEDIEEYGVEEYIKELSQELKDKTYRPNAVKRAYIPKANGDKRPLGIPILKDRIVQMATKIVIEPIFEADFEANSYGFRPKRNAHDAMEAIEKSIAYGHTTVIDADLSKYFDTISHTKLLALVAKRVVDKNILKLIKGIRSQVTTTIHFWLVEVYKEGYSQQMVATILGISQQAVYAVIKRNRKCIIVVSCPLLPAPFCPKSAKQIRLTIRRWKIQLRSDLSLAEIAKAFSPVIRGWVNYYSLFAQYKTLDVMRYFDRRLERWAKRKFKSLKRRQGRANKRMTIIAKTNPTLFPHWHIKYAAKLAK